MHNRTFLDVLEERCNVFHKSIRLVDQEWLEERDELIDFAKTAVLLKMVSQPEAQLLIHRVDRRLFAAA